MLKPESVEHERFGLPETVIYLSGCKQAKEVLSAKGSGFTCREGASAKWA